MLLGYNGLTTKYSTLEEDICLSAEHGFDAVELREYKIDSYLKDHSLEDIKAMAKNHSIKIVAINSMEIETETFRDSTAFFEKFERLLRYANELDVPYIVVAPMVNAANDSKEALYGKLQNLFWQMSDRAKETGKVQIGLEFIGLPNAMIETLDEALCMMKRIDRENVGLVIDTFAFFANGSRRESILSVEKEKLYLIHFNDSKVDKGPFREEYRTYPGEGVAPLRQWLQDFKQIGFDGAYTVELIDPRIWEQDTEAVIESAYQSINRVVGAFYQ